MSGEPLITHRTIPAAIITRTRPTPSMIKGTSSRSQKRGSRFGDIGGTSLFGAWTGGSTGPAAGGGGRVDSSVAGGTGGSRCLRKVIMLSRPSLVGMSAGLLAAKGLAARRVR